MTSTSFRNLTTALVAAMILPGCLAGATRPAAATAEPARLPDRTLNCRLGHATNLDPLKQQDRNEITFDSYHALSLRLPPIAARTTPPPDATEPAEPIDRRTRILSDPDGLTAGTLGTFERVIDLWPERVELTLPMDGGVSKLMILSDYDPATQTAQMFMTNATDLATFDFKQTYLGPCAVQIEERKKPA
ncbi:MULTISPECIES: hypothetical protein [Novosphingobium]|uniref:hypothetical protein n=1 Tax=Novosphingobium TaxID=165696 RepID=UPI001CD4B935|nr:hypothetical protein [Novosphingobium percolationis]